MNKRQKRRPQHDPGQKFSYDRGLPEAFEDFRQDFPSREHEEEFQ